jgi:hypothetical protein
MADEMIPETAGTPKTKEDLLARINADWTALLAVVEVLSQNQMLATDPGGWAVKDHLSHLAFWERYLMFHHLRGRASHEVLQIDQNICQEMDEDEINALIFERSRNPSASYILEDLHQTHEELLAALAAANFADFDKPGPKDDLVKRPLIESIASNTYDHYREHLRTIREVAQI